MSETVEFQKAKLHLAEALRHLNNVRNMTSNMSHFKQAVAIKELVVKAANKF